MEKYQNKKNGRIAEIESLNDRFNTYAVKYEDDGSQGVITASTLKRWWKRVEDAEVIEEPVTAPVEPIKEEPIEELVKNGDPGLLESSKKSPAKKKEQKSQQDMTAGNDLEEHVAGIVKEIGGTVFVPEKAKGFRAFKVNGKMFAIMTIAKKGVTIYCRSQAVKEVASPDSKRNHMFDWGYRIEATDDSILALVKSLLEKSKEFQLNKKAHSKEDK